MQAIYEAITALMAEGFIPISFCGLDVGRDNGFDGSVAAPLNIEALIRTRPLACRRCKSLLLSFVAR